MAPRAALERLAAGNRRYVADTPQARDFSAGRAARAAAQHPFAAVLACADSRVAPELLFDEGPGDLFVVRVAGNFVNADGLGSLEFGAAVLGTRAILVLGHTSCGAVDATVKVLREGNNDLPGDIATLVNAMKPGIEPALRDPGPDLATRALEANVRHAMRRLEGSPILAKLIGEGRLAVAGGIYELATGQVRML
ncbi:carbonic anhydrase [Roseomonas sp. NAR14]|uniref:carbonic anhydrase n=1 Tax=Roseomonas acroporae TaxID=2937791 RepID=A0A9X1Y5G0_9PROT|nr:carbonic anhydrase [Roseomonas acroporae]MCK8783400.1 carbonic anhydrase [Roseomonas acroporae]